MKKTLLLLYFSLLVIIAHAQSYIEITVLDSATHESLPGATAIVVSTGAGNAADADGIIKLNNIPDGRQEIEISFMGYKTQTKLFLFPIEMSSVTVYLTANTNELDEVTISVTRTNSRLDNSSLKVEVLGIDDMNEENTIKPGNVLSLLGDVSGIQLQQSSATSGNTNVRIQGLDGKYTQILRDGLPLYDGFSGGFGIMQVPPLDLKQIEIIKGSASTLFGGGAISGIINFVSKTPAIEPEGVLTFNQSTLSESNINGYYAKRNEKTGITLFSGFTRQNATDVDGDGFSDVPALSTMTIHPRVFWYLNKNTELNVGVSATNENRKGGDMQVLGHMADSAHRYFEDNTSQRYTADLGFTNINSHKHVLSIKGCASLFDLITESNLHWFGASQVNGFGEASYFIPSNKSDLVFGVNFNSSLFRLNRTDSVHFGNFSAITPGAFIQNTFKWKQKWFVEAGLRIDYNSDYGLFVLPRISGLYKINKHWFSRLGGGMGYKTPDLLETGVVDIDPYHLQALPSNIKSESSTGASFELNYSTLINDKLSLLVNQTFFYTQISSPLIYNVDTSGMYFLSNASKPVISRGSDTYIRASAGPWELYFGYTYTLAEQTYNATQRNVTYTPRHRAATTIVYEIEGKWRFGLEGSYNGYQFRDDGSKTPDYVFLAAMIERKIGKTSIVLNGENLLDFRQSQYESVVMAPFSNPTFKTLWAPIDGRVINLSVVFSL